jgi:uncharacterized protein (DUF849 family)
MFGHFFVLHYASLGSTTMATGKSGKVIISCAITGSIHTPTMSDALPITPDEIAAQAIEAAEAGAAILHLHARDPNDGRPTPDPAVYMRFLPRIKQATDAVVNITTGGSVHMSLEERLAAPLLAKPKMCSLNMGTMNFGIFPLAARYTSWKHDWEHSARSSCLAPRSPPPSKRHCEPRKLVGEA